MQLVILDAKGEAPKFSSIFVFEVNAESGDADHTDIVEIQVADETAAIAMIERLDTYDEYNYYDMKNDDYCTLLNTGWWPSDVTNDQFPCHIDGWKLYYYDAVGIKHDVKINK